MEESGQLRFTGGQLYAIYRHFYLVDEGAPPDQDEI
jgi:hypothetical protein